MVREQADALLAVVRRVLDPRLVLGVYLYGSAVAGGLHRDSDLDLFGIIARRLTDTEKRGLIEGLLPISGRDTRPPSWRPIELTLVVQDEIRPWRYPPRFDFQYGEWLRSEFVDGDLQPGPEANPDVAVLVTMVRADGVPLIGPPATDLLVPVPRDDLVRAMTDEVPSLLDDLESDTRNVLLTLARIWTTIDTGEVRSKDVAADWALMRLPEAHRPVLQLARSAYLGEAEDPLYDPAAVQPLARQMVAQIRRGCREP